MMENHKTKMIAIAVMLLAIIYGVYIYNTIRYDTDRYITKKEIVYVPVDGVTATKRNYNNYVRVYVTTPQNNSTYIDLSVWDLHACHSDILINKQIKYIRYTYNYGDVKYQAISNVFDKYCIDGTDLLKEK